MISSVVSGLHAKYSHGAANAQGAARIARLALTKVSGASGDIGKAGRRVGAAHSRRDSPAGPIDAGHAIVPQAPRPRAETAPA